MNKDDEKIAELYVEMLEEASKSHGSRQEIDDMLKIVYTVNDIYKQKTGEELAKVERGGGKISIYPKNSNTLHNFHEGQDKHPIRRLLRNIFKNDLDTLKQLVDRKYFRQYIQPILTGN